MSRLKEQYQNEIIDAMIKKFGYKNIMEVPKLDKVVINMGVGEAKDNAKALDSAAVSYTHLDVYKRQAEAYDRGCNIRCCIEYGESSGRSA